MGQRELGLKFKGTYGKFLQLPLMVKVNEKATKQSVHGIVKGTMKLYVTTIASGKVTKI